MYCRRAQALRLTRYGHLGLWRELEVELWKHQGQPRSYRLSVNGSILASNDEPNLHGTLVHQQAVKLNKGIVGAIGLVEDDGSNPTANTVRTVGDKGALDRANGFSEVFLYQRSLVPN